MDRLIKVTPGWFIKKRNSSVKHNKKYNTKYDSYKILNSEFKADLETNAETKNINWDSQQILNLEETKNSKDSKSIPKFKTLDDGSVDPADDAVHNIMNTNPHMKRSKTPSTQFKPINFSSQNKLVLDPKNYYANISESDPAIFFRETSSNNFLKYEPTNLMISQLTQFSSHANVANLKEVGTPTDDK